MKHEKIVIESEESYGFGHGDKEPKVQTVWNLIPLKDIIRKNAFAMISNCFWRIYDYRTLWIDWVIKDSYNLNEKNKEKVKLIKQFAMQCEHAYVLREARLKEEFKEEYENRFNI